MTEILVGDTVTFDPRTKTEFLEGTVTDVSYHGGIYVVVEDESYERWVPNEHVKSVNGTRV